jgi:hypothetical protein
MGQETADRRDGGVQMTERFERHLEGIDEDRRRVILTLVRAAAFAIPVVASFTIDGRLNVAHAQIPNATIS